MTPENLNGLEHCLRHLGFASRQGIMYDIVQHVAKGFRAFQLEFSHQFDKETIVTATLHFEREPVIRYYRFRKYKVTLQYITGLEADRSTIIYLPEVLGIGVTIQQAFNLLQGRAVYTTLYNNVDHLYNTWIKVNFGKIDRKGHYLIEPCGLPHDFNLQELLRKLPIRNFNTVKKRDSLVHSLQNGDRVFISLKGRNTHTMEIEVDVEKAALKTSTFKDSKNGDLPPATY